MIYGYARVSTKTQKLERQIANIQKYCNNNEYQLAEIYTDKFTGTTIDRPNFNKLLTILKADDTIIFDEVSRMSRNASDGFSIYQKLYEAGVNLEFIKEPHINTKVFKSSMANSINIATDTGRTSTDNLLSNLENALKTFLLDVAKEQIFLAFARAEKEVTFIQQRVKEGMKENNTASKISEARTGKRYHTEKEQEAKRIILKKSYHFNGTLNDTELFKFIGISRNTLKRYIAELLIENYEA